MLASVVGGQSSLFSFRVGSFFVNHQNVLLMGLAYESIESCLFDWCTINREAAWDDIPKEPEITFAEVLGLAEPDVLLYGDVE